jgi:hypothetical protein
MPAYTPPVNETLAPVAFDGGAVISGQLNNAQFGFQASTVPVLSSGGTPYVGTGSAIYLNGVYLGANITLSNLYYNVTTTQTTTHGVFGIYSAAGTLLATTADTTTVAGTPVGFKTVPLTASFTTTASGMYWLALCITAVTMPSLSAGVTATTGTILAGAATLAAGTYPFAVSNSTATTALPATITPASNTLGTAAIWMAAS